METIHAQTSTLSSKGDAMKLFRTSRTVSYGGGVRMTLCLLLCLLTLHVAVASEQNPYAEPPDGPMGVERFARVVDLSYQSKPVPSDNTVVWVQVDLGRSVPIDKVKLFPLIDWSANSIKFPVRFRVDASDDPTFATSSPIADYTKSDYPNPGDKVAVFACHGVKGRYVRITATELRGNQLVISKLEVWSNGKEVAVGRPATDSQSGYLGVTVLTRPPRPQGDEDVTDNPQNVIPASKWKPVPYRAHAPLTGVTLGNGLFKTVMENNIGYLLNSFTVAEMLRPFRCRAGKPNPPGLPTPNPFWDVCLPGSCAGRFMMGAGNTLRWIKNPELEKRLNELVAGIKACKEPNGYMMAYPPDTIFFSERAAYTRSWVTRGLVDAGFEGNKTAFTLLRGYYNWFDHNPYLPELLRRGGQGVQGMIANTRTYFTPIGKPEDIQVVQRYFQEDYWLRELAKREPKAIWQYPYDHPHCYLLTSIEPYLDMYRATGAKKYLDASLGGWYLYHNDWEHIGGSIAICEGYVYPPKSYYLHLETGELCGSVFWVRLNQRFHLLYPNQVKYVDEIEKSIYNVGFANQFGSQGIRYHANLAGLKDPPTMINTCCEGQGTHLFGTLPEYIYSIAKDGLYVDLFAPSTISLKLHGVPIHVKMSTNFPFSPKVRLNIFAPRTFQAKLRIRVPSWATQTMPIRINGKMALMGKPGSYAILNRSWRNDDTVAFTLPMGFRMKLYTGVEQNGGNRYALEYGPILMALTGKVTDHGDATVPIPAANLIKSLKPVKGEPLHFTIAGDPYHQYMPYFQVEKQAFTCFPDIGFGKCILTTVGPDDLALASKGATASSDSEYSAEPGCTAKVIDGIIATGTNFSNRWHSSLLTPHPHWVQVTLPKVEKVGRIVVDFADPDGYPVSFQGVAFDGAKRHILFDVKNYDNCSKYSLKIKPMGIKSFRFIIRASANPAYPNAAQISEIEMYP